MDYVITLLRVQGLQRNVENAERKKGVINRFMYEFFKIDKFNESIHA